LKESRPVRACTRRDRNDKYGTMPVSPARGQGTSNKSEKKIKGKENKRK